MQPAGEVWMFDPQQSLRLPVFGQRVQAFQPRRGKLSDASGGMPLAVSSACTEVLARRQALHGLSRISGRPTWTPKKCDP